MWGHGLCPQGPERSTVSSISAPRPRPHCGGPQDAKATRTSHSNGGLAGRHASHQADRRGEMNSFLLKHSGSRLKTQPGYFQWSPGDYATLSCSHDFKQPLKQIFCNMVSDPDLRDVRRLRPNLNWYFHCDPPYLPTKHLKC